MTVKQRSSETNTQVMKIIIVRKFANRFVCFPYSLCESDCNLQPSPASDITQRDPPMRNGIVTGSLNVYYKIGAMA